MAAGLLDLVHDVEKVAGAAGEAIQPRHQQHAIVGQCCDCLLELRTICPCSRCGFLEDGRAAGGPELLDLSGEGLAGSADAGIANHAKILHLTYAPCKLLRLQGGFFGA